MAAQRRCGLIAGSCRGLKVAEAQSWPAQHISRSSMLDVSKPKPADRVLCCRCDVHYMIIYQY